jgi:hypothetical protein
VRGRAGDPLLDPFKQPTDMTCLTGAGVEHAAGVVNQNPCRPPITKVERQLRERGEVGQHRPGR